jgi:hypothetical protein
MTLEAGDRAVVLDSAYVPAYIRAVGLALRLGQDELRLVCRLATHGSTPSHTAE